MKFKKGEGASLVLRVCRADFTSHNGFVWPSDVGAEIVAPDWKDNHECGNGLHGWLYGQGDHECVDFWKDPDAKWLVLEVPTAEIVPLGGKCKFPRAVVRYVGSKAEAADYLVAHEARAQTVAVIGLYANVGDKTAGLVGALGTLTGGNNSTLTGGNGSTLTGGHDSTLTGGYDSTLTGGNGSTLTGGHGSTLTGGYDSTLRGGNGSTLTGGHGSTLHIRWWDDEAGSYCTTMSYVGDGGLKANVPYRLDSNHQFVEVK